MTGYPALSRSGTGRILLDMRPDIRWPDIQTFHAYSKFPTVKFLFNHDILFSSFKEERIRETASTDPVNTDHESKDDMNKESDSSSDETMEKKTGTHSFLLYYIYCMSKKSWLISYGKSLNTMSRTFWTDSMFVTIKKGKYNIYDF